MGATGPLPIKRVRGGPTCGVGVSPGPGEAPPELSLARSPLPTDRTSRWAQKVLETEAAEQKPWALEELVLPPFS